MKTLSISLLIFVTIPLSAQSKIAVTHTRGKVYYYAAQQNNPTQIRTGASLSTSGRVQCGSGATVTLLYKGKPTTFSDTKTHYLDDVAKAAGNTSSLNFMGRFWNFLSGSMEGSEDNQSLEQHNKQTMESLHAGVKGYATADFVIQAGLMYEGNLSDKEVVFQWAAPEGARCCYRLSRQTDDALIMSVWTRGNILHLNMADLALEDGGVYEWQIITHSVDPSAPHSRKMQFAYNPGKASKALAGAGSQPAFQEASPVEQQLMQAFALEENTFLYDACQLYMKMAADNPDDGLVKRAYAAFLARIDRVEEAKELIK